MATAGGSTVKPPHINHVFIVVLENEDYSNTFGPTSEAPYLAKTLRYQGEFLPNYYGIGHSSLDNYIAMISGQPPTPQTQGDCTTYSDFVRSGPDAGGVAQGSGCVYPADINTSSPYGYYRVALLPGPVHLDGVQALQYVRSRHGDIRGDFARSERQQQLLLAMKAQSKHINLADFPDIASALNGEVRTSISLERARQLYSVLDQFDSAHIKRILLGAPYTSEGWAGDQSVVYPNWGQILPLVSQYFAQ